MSERRLKHFRSIDSCLFKAFLSNPSSSLTISPLGYSNALLHFVARHATTGWYETVHFRLHNIGISRVQVRKACYGQYICTYESLNKNRFFVEELEYFWKPG